MYRRTGWNYQTYCQQCKGPNRPPKTNGRFAHYCSNACRQKAYRQRLNAAAQAAAQAPNQP